MTETPLLHNRYRLFAVGAIGTFMGTLDGSILNVALPSIADELNASIDVVAWVVLAYSLTLVSLLMVFGAWTERKGYAFAYKFGYVFFLTGSIFSALSWDIYVLIGARIIQALGASMFQAVGTGMVTTVFPPQERGKGIGLMVMMVSAGLMAGPPLGGFILAVFPWQAIFVINVPIGLVGLALTMRYFKNVPTPDARRPVKWPGAVAVSVMLGAGMLGLTRLADHPVSDVSVWGFLLASVIAMASFVWIESVDRRALIGLEIFKNRQFVTSISAMLVLFISIAGVLILIPFYLERVKGMEPKDVGLYLIILPVVMFVVAPLSGRLSDRIGYRLLTSIGLATVAVGLFMLHGMDAATTGTEIALSLFVIAIGVGVFNTPNSSALMGSVGPDQRAISSSILSATRNIGMAMGIAIGTAFFTYWQSVYEGQGSADEVFIMSYRRVIEISIAAAIAGLPLCLIRANRSRSSQTGDRPSGVNASG